MDKSIVAVLMLVVLAFPASASHCVGYRTSHPELTLEGYYLDNDVCQPGCLASTWAYEESNGIPGLQRHDAGVDDTCHGMVSGDRRIV
ncbi:MAG TPA: hypothetical protein VM370_06615 [Candidatus Thermoplasmatota archaeon]|nr:hypothetical protein [Candidatus Thermoplasmatota archaeon]